ncbi:hypothetical protein AB1Y20_019514 [Prymnesium parvum]|uniref:Glycoside hydrolase family 5 domain-containing protein n=1 Tax=Prymnesium parvum TaxID=97485 RepID=A0AB34JV85_PRYPA
MHAQQPASYWTSGAKILTNAWSHGSKFPAQASDRVGEPVELRLNGVSWSGMESSPCVLGGLEKHDARDYLKQIGETMGFNALRIPFAADALLSALQPPLCVDDKLLSGYNKRYTKLSYSEQLSLFIQEAADYGLLVMLDLHRMESKRTQQPSGSVSNVDVMSRAWTKLARELCDATKYWNLFAFDLRNEPFLAHWGKPRDFEATGYAANERWDTVAARLGNEIQKACPRVLVMVEGVAGFVSMPDDASSMLPAVIGEQIIPGIGTWWGENLRGVLKNPVHLDAASDKVVYSPHTYGPSVYNQKQFGASDFPDNLNSIWDQQFGFIAKQGIAPIVIGEWGGKYHDDPDSIYGSKDRIWHGQLLQYIAENRIAGSFYWAYNPTSSDTGGLIWDWYNMEPDQQKVGLLSRLASTKITVQEDSEETDNEEDCSLEQKRRRKSRKPGHA